MTMFRTTHQYPKITLVALILAGLFLSACQASETTPANNEPEPAAPALIPTQEATEADPQPTPTAEASLDEEATESITLAPIVMSPEAPQPSLAKGINLAGDFEVDPRGDWGTKIEAHFFDLAAEGGFDHVRIPIRWSAHTGPAPSFLIDEAFFVEVDWVLDQAERAGLTTVIDTHHFEELDADPQGNRAQLNAIWAQIGARYANRPATVVFELNNEPTGAFNAQPELWNDILADALATVRQTNPDRLVIIGPVQFNHPVRLTELRLPDDPNLMVTVHVYDPTDFTAQGAPWFDPIPPTGYFWSGDWPIFDSAWQNDSWDSTVTLTFDGYNIAFDRQFAAFSATHLVGTVGQFDSLTVVTDQAFEAVALCNVAVEDVVAVDFGAPVTRDDGWVEMQADVSSCGDLRSVSVQLISEALVSPTLARVDLCMGFGSDVNNCYPIIVTEAEAHQRLMQRSAEWAAANNVDLYLGEFGVYDDPTTPVDRPSREAWIRSMRQSAEANGINWAFFELSGEFGAYDHANGRWHADILSALFED